MVVCPEADRGGWGRGGEGGRSGWEVGRKEDGRWGREEGRIGGKEEGEWEGGWEVEEWGEVGGERNEEQG